MNWKELYALVNENIKNAVSGLYKPAGDVTFAELPELSQSVLGYTYTVTDAFTTDSRFTDYDTESQTGHSFPADTEVAVIVTGTTENPVYMFNVMGGIMDGYATKGDLDNYVEKEAGKYLSTNDYTDADKALVQDSPITVSATGTDLTLPTSSGNVNALTVYGKSEVVNGEIVSAGEGYAVVDLGTLTWTKGNSTNGYFYSQVSGIKQVLQAGVLPNWICSKYNTTTSRANQHWETATENKVIGARQTTEYVCIVDNDYATADATAFKNSLSGVLLCYQLADPTQGNCIAIKTDNGTGIDGTMAVFETGTPLYGVSDTVRDVMMWDGSARTVTKKCDELDLGTTQWIYQTDTHFFVCTDLVSIISPSADNIPANIVTNAPYDVVSRNNISDKKMCINALGYIVIMDSDYNNAAAFTTAMTGVKLVYELATPTAEQLTTTENASIAGLRTFEPQTHAQNNAGATMTVKAYAGTANGKAVNELKQDVQSEISALKITQSDTLTLTTADWSSNQQTVTYAHDTAKRNVIDVDPSSVEEWASCGILATAETATSITFTCKTVPENTLTFKVTSMGVN